jgi:hypothetical protein
MSESELKVEDGVQAAQGELAQMQQRLQEAQLLKEQLAGELVQVRQEQRLKEKLLAAGTADTETAMLVVKSRLSQDDKAELDKVIEQVRREKPYLFEMLSTTSFTATRGAKDKSGAGQEKIKTAAAKAIKTAGRTELMEYMKARRRG